MKMNGVVPENEKFQARATPTDHADTASSGGVRSPDTESIQMSDAKSVTPAPSMDSSMQSPGSYFRESGSERGSRISMLTPGDKNNNNPYKGRFTGKITLKNPFG